MLKYYIILVLFFFAACNENSKEAAQKEESSTEKVVVAAVNYPLAYFAKDIGGEYIEIIYPVPEGEDPAFWSPTPEEISLFQNADVILLNGADYAKWVGTVSLPWSSIVNTTYEVRDQYIDVEQGVTHSHGPEGEHAHAGYAFTTWLDIDLAKAQAGSVYESLLAKLPDQASELKSNYETLINSLDDLGLQLKESLGTNAVYYGSHPVYQYLARYASVEVHSVHWEPGEEVSDEQWHELEHIMEDHSSNVMLWEGEPNDAVEKKLNDLGIRSIVFQTGSNTPADGGFLSIMNENIDNLNSLN